MHTRPMLYFIFVIICVELAFSESADKTEMSFCSFEQKTAGKYPNYYHGVPIIPMVIVLDKTNNSKCVINSTTIIQAYHFPENQTVVGYFLIKCQTQLKILFTDTETQQNAFPNVIGYLQVSGCIVENSIDLFSNIVDMRVYLFRDRTGFATDGPSSSYYGINDKTISLGIDDIDVSNGVEVVSVFKHNSTYSELKEIALSGLELEEFPNNLKNKLPNLESLEMPNNSLTYPPIDFPWNDKTSDLPLNLSRSQYLQHQYATSRHLDIPANKYARLFNLNDNKIVNLTDFRFHGKLHMITINNNGLRHIGEDCFWFVSDLQFIGLANNQLTSLPLLLFKDLYSLRRLDLRNNSLMDLQSGLFRDLTNLVYLNLASNQLHSLPVGLFENLTNIRELILDGNRLTSCDGSFQPHKSIYFQHLSLNNNPLHNIPIGIFYSRSIKRIDLRNTTITLSSFKELLLKLNPSIFAASVVESSSDSQFNLLKRPKEMKEIDLTGSKVRDLNPGVNLDHQTEQKLLVILIHFHIKLDYNPLSCDCGIIPLLNFVHKYIQNGTLSRSDYYFREWTCVYPLEFSGRQILEVKEKETYCRVNVSFCPDTCLCYERAKSLIIIVDCRETNMKALPLHLPEGVLDLWFQRNNITWVETRNYLNRVRTFFLNSNQISHVDGDAVLQLKIIENFHMSSNNLISLPEQMQHLQLTELTVGDNPFSCDCHSLWMRSWIERNKDVVTDSSTVTCNTQIGTARPLLKVPATEFVCKEDFDAKKHVIIPATVSSLSVCLVLVVIAFVCIYRLEVKVFFYIYLGIRPFDNEKTLQKKAFDLVIIHSSKTQEWVNKNVLPLQETNGSNLHFVDICKDLIAGFSVQENITCLIEQARQVVFVLSEDFMDDERLQMAWTGTRNRIVENGLGFIQFVTDSISISDITDSDMVTVMKKTHCLTTQERFIKNKLLYIMELYKSSTQKCKVPELRSIIEKRIVSKCQAQNQEICDIFLSYSDESRTFALHELYPHLEAEGYSISMPEKDFTPGVAKDDNIMNYLYASYHTLFVMSTTKFDDEWELFTFREALQRSRRDKYNHLIIVLTSGVQNDTIEDEELRHYLQSHVTLRADAEDFERNLQRCLRPPFCIIDEDITVKITDDIV